MHARVDWCQLPPELLHLIAKRLPDLAGFVRFRAVCTKWRSSVLISDAPPQMPWLLQHRKPFDDDLQFYSMASSEKVCVIRDRVGRSRAHASGALHGCLLQADLSVTNLRNPISKTHVVLPPPPFPLWRDGVIYVPNPIGSQDCVVVNTCLHTRKVAFCRPGDKKWAIIPVKGGIYQHAYYKGRFFVNTKTGDTVVIDATTLAVLSVVPPPPIKNRGGVIHYLVVSSGKLLTVVSDRKNSTSVSITASRFRPPSIVRQNDSIVSVEDCHFGVFQLDLKCEELKWIKIPGIGDQVLFFDDYGHGFACDANNSTGFTRNCIYFVETVKKEQVFKEYLCRYSFEEGRVDKLLPLPQMFGHTWFVPSL